jgi:hypothetical protein
VVAQAAGQPLAAQMAAVLPGEAQLSAAQPVVSSALGPLTVVARLSALAQLSAARLPVALHVEAQRVAAVVRSDAAVALAVPLTLVQLSTASAQPVAQLPVGLYVEVLRSDAAVPLALAQLLTASAQPVLRAAAVVQAEVQLVALVPSAATLGALSALAQPATVSVQLVGWQPAVVVLQAALWPAAVASLLQRVVFQIVARLPVCAERSGPDQGRRETSFHCGQRPCDRHGCSENDRSRRSCYAYRRSVCWRESNLRRSSRDNKDLGRASPNPDSTTVQ